MAKSQYEYVKQFELSDTCLPRTWIMCRIDGIGFTKFTAGHNLVKPNDSRARDLMNNAARTVMLEYPDICIAYGVSDEYSFVLHPMTELYSRRASKISSAIVSLFTAAYVANWSKFFTESPLEFNNLPFFDSRIVCYPTDGIIKDYLRWRQVDCHINNLYNVCFWKLVRRYQERNKEWSERQARDKAHEDMNSLYASSSQKNDLLHDEFGINYNNEPDADRKGSILVWREVETSINSNANQGDKVGKEEHQPTTDESIPNEQAQSNSSPPPASSSSSNIAASSPSPSTPISFRIRRTVVVLHCDLIQDSFYRDECPGIIPFLSWSDLKKLKKSAEKAAKKAEHKKREKAEKEAKRFTQSEDLNIHTQTSSQ